jgi:hypothetical protein
MLRVLGMMTKIKFSSIFILEMIKLDHLSSDNKRERIVVLNPLKPDVEIKARVNTRIKV